MGKGVRKGIVEAENRLLGAIAFEIEGEQYQPRSMAEVQAERLQAEYRAMAAQGRVFVAQKRMVV